MMYDSAMDSWISEILNKVTGSNTGNMMSSNRAIPDIKQEVESPATPTQNYHQVCSPSTTIEHPETLCEIEMPDYGGGLASPASPELQHCSSTTQPLGTPEGGIKEEDMVPRRLCLVCGDVASGFHYGVASCEACKAFFKRTIQGNIEYTCPANRECEINKRRRKACQSCRFEKCLKQGMLKEGVRLDRVRGGRQKYRRSADPYLLSKSVTIEANVGLSRSPETTNNNKMIEALVACEPDILQVFNVSSHTLETEQRVLCQLADLYDRELVGVIGWAKLIPGFSDLALADQMRLLQNTWAEILMFSLAWRSTSTPGRLRFAQDFTMDERLARDCRCIELYTHCIQIVERIQKLNLTKEEFYILKALILTNSDVHLDDAQALYRFRETLLSTQYDWVSSTRPMQAIQATQNMLLIFPSLRQADNIVRRFWLCICKTGKVPMNKLFVEMLEAGGYR